MKHIQNQRYTPYQKKESDLTLNQENELKTLRKKIIDNEVTEKYILCANITEEQKILCLRLFTIMINYDNDSNERYEYEEKIKKIVNDEIIQKINNSLCNSETKQLLYYKYKCVANSHQNEEYYKVIEWINTVISLPIEPKITFSTKDMYEKLVIINKVMNENIYGNQHVKERILETICNLEKNANINKIIALVGPAGIGKTTMAKCIAKSLDLPFQQISFGGLNDVSFILGHGSTYVGSKVGAITNAMIKMKCTNGVLFFDEIDKISNTENGNEIHSALLHILDKTQNERFRDLYLSEIEIDISKLFIIVAMNDENKINNVLRDRLTIIKMFGYDIDEKITICRNFLSKQYCGHENIIINDNVLMYIIKKYTSNEEGVRKLEQCLCSIYEKINLLAITKNKKEFTLSYNFLVYSSPFIVTNKIVDIFLKNT